VSASNDAVLEVGYDHYKEAHKLLCSNLAIRIRMIVVILALLLVMLFQSIDPRNTVKIVSNWLHSLVGGDNLAIDALPSFLSFLLWFTLSSLIIQSFQKSLVIERQSIYLQRLELWLDRIIGTSEIRLMRYRRPKFFHYSNMLYFGGFLALVGSASSWKLFTEFRDLQKSSLGASRALGLTFASFDVIMFILIIFFCYRFMVDFRSLAAEKERLPDMAFQASEPPSPAQDSDEQRGSAPPTGAPAPAGGGGGGKKQPV
jgi:phosphate starvation-inducible membrane PsiE